MVAKQIILGTKNPPDASPCTRGLLDYYTSASLNADTRYQFMLYPHDGVREPLTRFRLPRISCNAHVVLQRARAFAFPNRYRLCASFSYITAFSRNWLRLRCSVQLDTGMSYALQYPQDTTPRALRRAKSQQSSELPPETCHWPQTP